MRINLMYASKYLTRTTFSLGCNVSTVSRPKSSILILMLLFLSGDTGATINPGPIGLNNINNNLCTDDRYPNNVGLSQIINDFSNIDPDINHFTPEIHFESHSVSTFSNKQDIDPNALKIIHHNARSLMKSGRIDEYEIYLETLKTPFDILIFTETWLTLEKVDQCNFENFKAIHLIRPLNDNIDFKDSGGGISIFIKKI